MIGKGNILSIQYKRSLRGPKSMRNVDVSEQNSVESYSFGADPQNAPPTSPLLLLGDVTVQVYPAGATQQRLYASRIMTPHLLLRATIT
jgi:hypothetical protein